MGITTPLVAEPSIVLGSENVNVLEMADAYATMANEGIHHAPQAIEKVVFPNGRVVRTKVKGNRVLSPGVAYTVDKILEQNTSYAGGTARAMPNYYAGRSAGKTGTTSNYVDAWFCGFNPRLATAVWMGYPQASTPMPGVFGATYCIPIWGTFYNAVFGSTYIPDFAMPAIMPLWKPWRASTPRWRPRRRPRRRRRRPRRPSPAPPSRRPQGRPRRRRPPRRRPTRRRRRPHPTLRPTSTALDARGARPGGRQ